jgi:hypothetical protein
VLCLKWSSRYFFFVRVISSAVKDISFCAFHFKCCERFLSLVCFVRCAAKDSSVQCVSFRAWLKILHFGVFGLKCSERFVCFVDFVDFISSPIKDCSFLRVLRAWFEVL